MSQRQSKLSETRWSNAIERLHKSCNVYTSPLVAGLVLDLVRWTNDMPRPGEVRLLEPSAGDGILVAEAAKRLLSSFKARRKRRSYAALKNSIVAFELSPAAATEARRRVRLALKSSGTSARLAALLARRWIKAADFLLSDIKPTFTHVVGNPPY